MKNRPRRFVKPWIDLFSRHQLLDHASAIAFQVLKSLVPLRLLGLALLGALGEERVRRDTIAPGIESHLQPATIHAIDVAGEKIFAMGGVGADRFFLLARDPVHLGVGARNDGGAQRDLRSRREAAVAPSATPFPLASRSASRRA
jgi:hypothetical protein